MAEF
jgi:hypothetical protein